MRLWRIPGMPARCSAFLTRILKQHFRLRRVPAPLTISILFGVVSENGIYGHSRFCNTDFDDKLACLNLSGV